VNKQNPNQSLMFLHCLNLQNHYPNIREFISNYALVRTPILSNVMSAWKKMYISMSQMKSQTILSSVIYVTLLFTSLAMEANCYKKRYQRETGSAKDAST